jgi:ubiquinone/menaquinone biosynthesis C-methylase UbiE
MVASSQAQDIAEYYDSYSTWYEGERREGYYGLINELEVEVLRPYAIGRDVLELGCGTGLILEHTAKLAKSAVAIDLSLGMAGVSREKDLTVANASATNLPFSDDSFDLVYSCKVLPHVPDIVRALQEVDRVLRPGGTAILEFYNPLSFKALTYRLRTIMRRREPVWVRHDDAADVATYLPENWSIDAVRGIRIVAPVKQLYELPLIGTLLGTIERRLCDTRIGARFGGYLLVRSSPKD